MVMENQVRTASIISALFAVWLFVSQYVLGFGAMSVVAMWVADIASIGVLALSLIRFFNTSIESSAMSWINALVGLALIASPFVLYLTGVGGVLWDFVIVGIAFVVFNVWAALAHLITI